VSLSIRSTKRNTAHERPVTPVTGKPYTALRPSSRGGVRHALNLEDAFAVGQDMQSRDPTLLAELKAQDGDYKREMRWATEANMLIDDDEVRWFSTSRGSAGILHVHFHFCVFSSCKSQGKYVN
jgi:hypothetical protein